MGILGRLFEGKEKRQQREQADAEMRLVQGTLDQIYGQNNSDFFQRPGAAKLAMDLVLAQPVRDVSGLFALGVAMQAVEKLPSLPTSPYDRAYIHLMRFFNEGETSFEEAQQRVVTIEEQVESLDNVVAWIVAQGREAAREEDDPAYLTRCYEAVHRQVLISGAG